MNISKELGYLESPETAPAMRWRTPDTGRTHGEAGQTRGGREGGRATLEAPPAADALREDVDEEDAEDGAEGEEGGDERPHHSEPRLPQPRLRIPPTPRLVHKGPEHVLRRVDHLNATASFLLLPLCPGPAPASLPLVGSRSGRGRRTRLPGSPKGASTSQTFRRECEASWEVWTRLGVRLLSLRVHRASSNGPNVPPAPQVHEGVILTLKWAGLQAALAAHQVKSRPKPYFVQISPTRDVMKL